MSSMVEIRFPDDQQEGTEATVTRWLAAEGDLVAAHDPVAEIETDKVVVEVAAPEAGRIISIRIQPDEEVNPGDVLCLLDTSGALSEAESAGEAVEATSDKAGPGTERERLSPAVRHKAKQHGLDLSAISGSGKDGRITLEDVEEQVRQQSPPAGLSAETGGQAEPIQTQQSPPVVPYTDTDENAEAAQTEQSPPAGLSDDTDEKTQPAQTQHSPPAGPSVDTEKMAEPVQTRYSPPVRPSVDTETIAHTKMRKRIADNMVASLMHTAPHVTAVFEADLGAVMQHRATHKGSFESAGTPLTLTAYFVAAAVAGIQRVPQVNSRWFDDHLEIYHHINMGIGTALGDEGLIVPVIHDVQNMNLKAIATQLADLTERARDNKLKPQDVRDGTFTISNHGVSGSLFATPIIINQPQSAILGIGKIEKRVKIREIDGQDVIAIKPMCYITLTIDHRALDGHQTNTFLSTMVETLETWT